MKYKVCNVYTGYAEMGVEGIETIQVDMSLEEATKQLNIETTVDLEDAVGIEFLDFWVVGDGAGFIAAGEENMKVVLPEGHAWYDKVSIDNDMPEEVWSEWQVFCRPGLEVM